MNKIYWIIVSRDDFTNLYKFRDIEVDFSDIIHNAVEKSLENKFKNLPFDNEFGFIIIKFEDKSYNQNSSKYKLDIRNCKSIYALSEVSQKWYSVKFNKNIKFNVIEYPNILENVKNYKYLENINMGIDILFEQFNIKNKKTFDEKFDAKFKEKVLEYKSSNQHFFMTTNFENFYFDLLLYERKNDKFGKEDVSYIYDVVVLVILQDRAEDKVKEFYTKQLKITDKYPFCITLNKENKKDKLLKNINLIKEKEEPDFKIFIEKIDIKDLIISSLFLKIKDLLNEEDGGQKDGYQEEIKSLVNDFQSDYKEEVSIALYLIGLVFGYEKLYNYYYDSLELDLFKDDVKDMDYKKKFEELQSLKDNKIKKLSDEKSKIEREKEEVDKSNKEAKDKIESLKEENKELKLKLEKMQEPSNKETTQNDSDIEKEEESKEVISEGNIKVADVEEKEEVENHIILKSNLNDEEIVQYSITFLREIVNNKEPIDKKLYPNNKQSKIRLYNKIFNKEVEETPTSERDAVGLFNETITKDS